jgi:hypothetical protein
VSVLACVELIACKFGCTVCICASGPVERDYEARGQVMKHGELVGDLYKPLSI